MTDEDNGPVSSVQDPASEDAPRPPRRAGHGRLLHQQQRRADRPSPAAASRHQGHRVLAPLPENHKKKYMCLYIIKDPDLLVLTLFT